MKRWASGGEWAEEEAEQQRRDRDKKNIIYSFFEVCASALGNQIFKAGYRSCVILF